MKLHHLHDPKQKELLAVIKNSFLGIDIGSVSVSYAVLVFPNPLSSNSVVELNLTEASQVNVEFYDALGRNVGNVHQGMLDNGTYSFGLEQFMLSKGTYFVRVTANNSVSTNKFIVLE